MAYVFGIDGGGTSARLRIEGLDGTRIFYGEGGSTNPNSTPLASIEATLSGLFSQAQADARILPEDCAAGFVGTAGVDRPADKAPFSALIRRSFRLGEAVPLGIGNDAEPALAGALGDIEGILLIAGTGAIAYGRARDGFAARAGGLGHLLGDEGSAFRVAFDAIARSLRSREGRDLPTGLLEEALAFFGLSAPEDFVPFVYGGFEKAKVARFARVVGAARDRGDPLALDLFDIAAKELSALVVSVYDRIGSRLRMPRASMRGGLIEGDARLRAAVENLLRGTAPGLEIVLPASDAATGACMLARALID